MAKTKLAPAELLRAATAVFRRRGYAGTSMTHLAEAAGLTKGAFYHYYASKAAVMEAALAATHEFAVREVFAPTSRTDRPLRERVARFEHGARRLFRDPEQGCFFANTALAGGPEVARFRPAVAAFVDDWRACLARLAADAGLPDPAAFALRTVADIEGAIVLMRVYRDLGHLDAALARFSSALLGEGVTRQAQ